MAESRELAYRLGAALPPGGLPMAAAVLPLHSDLLAVRDGSVENPRTVGRFLADRLAAHALPALRQTGLRSGAARQKQGKNW